MKKILQINCLALVMIALFFVKSYGQQKPSERSFTGVMNQIKQKQATQWKMTQQVKQATPATPATTGTRIHQQPQPVDGTNGQPLKSTPLNQRPIRISKKK